MNKPFFKATNALYFSFVSYIVGYTVNAFYVQEVMEEHESERARLQHQLQTAEQLLRDAPKDMLDSRPNSFVSNSSSSASVGDTTDSQINGVYFCISCIMYSSIV